ncbi:aspartate--tRNA ligase, partial [bacterium]|nr:aspartate--tRNA ligase [bacterium]
MGLNKELQFEVSSRTHTCGEIRSSDIGKNVTLCGWVQKSRDLGSLKFIDLRDRYGITQLVFDSTSHPECFATAKKLKMEYVIRIIGTVRSRPDDALNTELSTGTIEVLVDSIEVLNESKTLPFMIENEVKASEELRFKYRYLDLRRSCLQKNLIIRDIAMQATREYLHANNFVDIETPHLFKSTPEGARDYLVPSRIHKGKFYALPQSPQLLKQILVIAGFDRYFQIVKCFRDEDQRANRQPEFTQIDIEMSFVDEKDVFKMAEGLFAYIFLKTIGVEIKKPFQIISFDEAYSKYGTDKPDLRFGLVLEDITQIFSTIEAKFIREIIDAGGDVVGFKLDKECNLSRKDIDNLTEEFKKSGGKGLIWIKYTEGEIKSSISKFLTDEINSKIKERLSLAEGETILLSAEKEKRAF